MTQSRDTGEVLNTRGTAATVDTGLLTGNVPTADELSMVGQTVNYTAANLNPNVYGGVDINRTIGIGFARSGTVAYILLPSHSIESPSSITVADTFSVYDKDSTLKGSGITPTLITSAAGATLLSFATSGLTTGEVISIRTDSADSLITVNS